MTASVDAGSAEMVDWKASSSAMSRKLAMVELRIWGLERNVVEWEAGECAETSKTIQWCSWRKSNAQEFAIGLPLT